MIKMTNVLTPLGKLPRKQALETVRNNIKWLETHSEVITKWLAENVV